MKSTILIGILSAVLGFSVAKSFQKSRPPAVTITTITNSAPARIDLISTNGERFADITIKPGRSVDLHGIDQVGTLAFITNRDESIFIHDWKSTNWGVRIWPGRN